MTKLKLMTIARDDWEKLRKENSDLRAKMEAAERKIEFHKQRVSNLNKYCLEIQQERDDLQKENLGQSNLIEDLRRQLEEEKVSCYQFKSNGEMWFKEAKKLESQNAVLRGAMEEIKQLFPKLFECCSLDDCLNTDCTMANEADMMCRQIAKLVRKALTASGDNRYARIEEVAKIIAKDLKCCENDDDIANDVSGICPDSWSCSNCPIKNLAAALGDGE